MKRAKKILTLLIFSIAVAFIGCPEPVGSLLTDIAPEYIKAEPERFLYKENDRFWPEDVKVLRVGSFGEKHIDDTDNIKIFIEDANNEKEEVQPTGFVLSPQGIKTVYISYQSMNTSYRIEVVDPSTTISDGDGTAIKFDLPW